MEKFEAIYAAHEIHTLMTKARQSVSLFAPDGWQFFSFENYPPTLNEVAQNGVIARFIFGYSMFPAELDPNRHLPRHGCDIRIQSAGDDHISYVIVDDSCAIRGKYVPGFHYPYDILTLEEDKGTITDLLHHFEGAWSSAHAIEILFLPSDCGEPLIHTPTLAEVVGWTPRLAELAVNPGALFRLTARNFEELVAELLIRDGFEITLTPRSHDGGRDVLAVRSLPTGPMLCLVECKRYAKKRPVSIEYVRGLFGTVTSEGASNGLIVTTSSFTKPAREFARRHYHRLALKEYTDLVTWIRRVCGR